MSKIKPRKGSRRKFLARGVGDASAVGECDIGRQCVGTHQAARGRATSHRT